ncbi:F-box only protein 9 [Diorhabda carinulata]|uniref:F-box only protein 9 n=1 Tax=Diorhabda carinulata TaxID=1163345 RepID=UPI0025A2F01F|nr:F-box only protein 9 [Diorhabda carinulata]
MDDDFENIKKSDIPANDDNDKSAVSTREDDLSSFREQWQKEIQSTKNNQTEEQFRKVPTTSENNVYNNVDLKTTNQDDDNERATRLFLKGIEMENSGKLYEAIQYYKQAVQIVPDVEYLLHKKSKMKLKQDSLEREVNIKENTDVNDVSTDDDEDNKDEEIYVRLQRKVSNKSTLCLPKQPKRGIHIGQMPFEVILYILKWVVSEHLDMRSLEMFSRVCRGFYVCARDPEIWRIACMRIWGVNCGSSPGDYKTWRNMFIDRPRVNFNGCYISKTTYIRNGENSFQDQFYRPWYLVAYYRYLRFYPDGTVIMLTSADEPSQSINLLKNKNVRDPVLSGYYRLKDDKIMLVIQRHVKNAQTDYKRDHKKQDAMNKKEIVFNMEFQIKSKRKKHDQLHWSHYSIATRGRGIPESITNFDLYGSRYPPLVFSRVKSYTENSENLLT